MTTQFHFCYTPGFSCFFFFVFSSSSRRLFGWSFLGFIFWVVFRCYLVYDEDPRLTQLSLFQHILFSPILQSSRHWITFIYYQLIGEVYLFPQWHWKRCFLSCCNTQQFCPLQLRNSVDNSFSSPVLVQEIRWTFLCCCSLSSQANVVMRYECYKPAIASIFYGPVVSLFFIINRFGFKNDEFPSFSNHYQAYIDFLSKVTTYCYFEPIHELFTIYSKLFYSTVCYLSFL